MGGGFLVGVMDPVFERGVGPEFSAIDIRVLDLIGWDLESRASADCNENGLPDVQDLATGQSRDCNDNNVPDACELGDFDGDADVDLEDFAGFISCSSPAGSEPPGSRCEVFDAACDGVVDLTDWGVFQVLFTGGPL